MMKPLHSIKIVVPFGDIDMMGHVNNVRFFSYLEQVRTDYLYLTARSTDEEEKFPVRLIMAHVEIDYKAPARWRDELTIRMRTASVGTSSWVYEYEILNEKENRLVALGKSVQVAYDYDAGKSINLPPEVRKRLLEEVEKTID
ncbi:MAG: acyl-CoA thioesterase [Rhabdochlamydiaceae bacterium]